jgi:outer membrane protein assembly factor BamB
MSPSLALLSTRRLLALLLVLPAALLPGAARGGDWPQILGPARNGAADGEALPQKLPAGGPPLVWKYAVGAGYAGPVVSGKTAVIFHRVGNVERIEALEANSGKPLWKADFPVTGDGGIDPDNGPRASPLIHAGRVYVLGVGGDLHCVELAGGRKVWSRAAGEDFGAQPGYFGFGSSPIVAGGKLLVNVGGSDGAGIVAFALDTGQTLWKATSDDASYSSPTQAVIDGQTHVIFVTRLNVFSLDPATGKVRFQFPFGSRGPTVNAAAPIVFEKDRLFVTAAYGVGAAAAKIGPQGAKVIWSNDTSLSSQYNTPVYHEGHLYGIDGREDYDNGKLRCVKADTGEIVWSDDDFKVAHLILAGDKFLALKTTGEMIIAPATPEGFRPLATARVASAGAARALPALAGGRLYFRTSEANRGELRCVALGQSAAGR